MSYRLLRDMAPTANIPPEGENSPLTMCLVDTMDRKFHHGGETSQFTGTRSVNCHHFMAQRCAKKWDGFCEYFYRENGPDGGNRALTLNPIGKEWEAKYNTVQTLGEHMLKNTAEQKYCTFSDCTEKVVPFNPITPNSVQITEHHGACIPTCTVDPKTIDDDPVMNRLLDNPMVAPVTIINICNTMKNQNVDMANTRIGKVCQLYFDSLKQQQV